MKLLLRVFSSENYDWLAFVDLTPAYARRLLKLREAMKAAKKLAGGVYDVRSTDSEVRYIPAEQTKNIEDRSLPASVYDAIDENGYAEMPDDFDPPEAKDCATDIDFATAHTAGVAFWSMPDDDYGENVETEFVPWRLITKVAETGRPTTSLARRRNRVKAR